MSELSENMDYRDRLMNLDVLIEERENLRGLTEQPSWKTLLTKLAEIRVDAMDLAVADGDTTDIKAYARALGTIMNFFYSLDNTVEIDDLMAQKDLLRNEIKMVDEARRNQYSTSVGLGATL